MPTDNQCRGGCSNSCPSLNQSMEMLSPLLQFKQLFKFLKIEMVFENGNCETVYLKPTPGVDQRKLNAFLVVCGLPEFELFTPGTAEPHHFPTSIPSVTQPTVDQTQARGNGQQHEQVIAQSAMSRVCIASPQQVSDFQSNKRQKTLSCPACVSQFPSILQQEQTHASNHMDVTTNDESSQALETDDSSVYTAEASPRIAVPATPATPAAPAAAQVNSPVTFPLVQVNSPATFPSIPNTFHLLPTFAPSPSSPFVPVPATPATVQSDVVCRSSRIDDYFCEHCDKTFQGKSNLDRHIRQVVNKIKKYICGRCGSGHTQLTNCQSHIAKRKCKESENRIKCPGCPVRCRTEKDLKKHQCAQDWTIVPANEIHESVPASAQSAASEANDQMPRHQSSSPNNALKRKSPDFGQLPSSNASDWSSPFHQASCHSLAHTITSTMSDGCERRSLSSSSSHISSSFVQQFRNLNHTH